MTTIAYRDGILAADTQETNGGLRLLCRKLDKWPDGRVVACAGNSVDFILFREYILGLAKKKKSTPDLHKGFEALIIDDGEVYEAGRDCVFQQVHATYKAIGGGHAVAAAAMHIGLSAKDAVILAGELSEGTNTMVDTYNIKTKRFSLHPFPK